MKYVPIVFAVIGVGFTIVYVKWGFTVLQVLRDIREKVNTKEP